MEFHLEPEREGSRKKVLVFCQGFRHWRTGKWITRPNGRPFCFRVKA